MTILNMNELTKALNDKGIPATFSMSGGGCGTIYAGNADGEGFYECAVGPSVFSSGLAEVGDLCYSKDGEEVEVFYVEEGQSVGDIAEEIESLFFTSACGACGLLYTRGQADAQGFHAEELCEEAN